MAEIKRDRTSELKRLPGLIDLPQNTTATLSKTQIAAALNYSLRSLDALVSAGGYPRPDFLLNRSPRWRVATHNAWVDEQVERHRPYSAR